jgi:hypothetical protein
MDPVRVLQLARSLGAIPTHLVIVGCEPATIESGGSLGDELCSLSPAVDRAITEAVNAVGRLISSASAVTPSSQGGNQCR